MSKTNISLYSFSKLDTYLECSYKFKYKYIDIIDVPPEVSIETTVGSWVHDALESFYGNTSDLNPYDYFTAAWKQMLTNYNMYDQFTEFTYLASLTGNLYLRARPDYIGKDALRTRSGATATKPELLAEFKQELAQTDFHKRKALLDLKLSKKSQLWKDVSAVDCFCQASFLCYNYKNPKDIHEVYSIEMGLSEATYQAADPVDPSKPFKKGNLEVGTTKDGPHPMWKDANDKYKILKINNEIKLKDNVFLNGYIDLISKTKSGKLSIIDHKTSSGDPPEIYKVQRHHQLLLYGWAVHKLSGEKPDLIGINHIKSGKLVLANYDHSYAQEVVDTKLEIIKAIENKVFIKRDPFAYNSPCIKKLSTGTRYCPYIKNCHPWLDI